MAFLDLVAETQTANGPRRWQAALCSQVENLAAYRSDGVDPILTELDDIDRFTAELCKCRAVALPQGVNETDPHDRGGQSVGTEGHSA